MNRLMREAGQGLSEYTLIGTCLLVPAIAALILLGTNVTGLFNGMFGQKNTAAITSPAGSSTSGSGTANTQAGAPSGTITLKNGMKIPIHDSYPHDVIDSLQTSGANGTTEKILAQLNALIQASESTLTPEQADLLKKLAEQGHKIAGAEKLIEEAVTRNLNNSAAYEQELVTYDGDTLTAAELGSQLGYNPDNNGEGGYVVELRALLKKAEAGGALSDPAMAAAVTILVDQIANIANGVESSSFWMANVEPPGSMGRFNEMVVDALDERDETLGINTQKTLLDMGASEVTRQDSNEICDKSNTNACIKKG